MEIVEVKCANCTKEIYVQQQYIREKMFCTIGCMYPAAPKSKGRKFH